MADLFENTSPIEAIWCLTDLAGAVFAAVLLVLNVKVYRRQQDTNLNGGLSILLLGEIVGLFLWLLLFLTFLVVGWVAAMAPIRPDAYTNLQAYNWANYAPLLLVVGNGIMLLKVFLRMVTWLLLDRHNRRRPHDRRATDGNGGPSDTLAGVQAMQADMAEIHAASAPPPGGPDAAPLQVTIVQDPHAPVPVTLQPADEDKP